MARTRFHLALVASVALALVAGVHRAASAMPAEVTAAVIAQIHAPQELEHQHPSRPGGPVAVEEPTTPSTARAHPELVTVGISNFYDEFAHISEDGVASGLAVEVLKQAAARSGLQLRFVYVPIEVAWDQLADGTVDVLAFQSVAEVRFDDTIYGPPYVVTHGQIYSRPETPRINDPNELSDHRVMVDGNLAKPWLSSHGVSKVLCTRDVLLAIQLLQAGEADYYATTRLAYRTAVKRAGLELNLAEHTIEGPTFSRAFASAFASERQELHGKLLRGIAQVMATPEYPGLYSKYAGEIEPSPVEPGVRRSVVLWGLLAAVVIIAAATTLVVSLRSLVCRQRRALAQSQSRYRQLFEASEDAILVISPSDGRVLDANPAATRIYGWSLDELRAMDIMQITTNREHAEECLREVVSKGFARGYACQHLTKHRGIIQIEASVVLVEAFGQPAFAIYLRDATERLAAAARERAMEARLARTQRLEGLALLAGGVAHDFNNLLMSISGNAELVRLRSKGDPRLEKPTTDIVRAARMATELTQQMLDTAGSTSVKTEPTDLSVVATEIVAALGPRLGTTTRATLELDPALPTLDLDGPRLRRVLMNVLTNAADATTTSGSITIRTGQRHLDQSQLAGAAAGSTLPPGEYLVIEVEDTGEGMSEDVLARIFDPFFTTKPHGRGLGLSVVLGTVRRMGGAVLVRSAAGVGSCFTLAFPADQGRPRVDMKLELHPAEPGPAGGDLPIPAGSRGRALVVDDSIAVMSVTGALLSDLGWEVTTASTVEAARAEVARGGLKLIIADVLMPDGGGTAVLAESRERQPHAAVVFMSGHAPEGSLGALVPDAFLQKPFGLRELETAVAEALTIAHAREQGAVSTVDAA